MKFGLIGEKLGHSLSPEIHKYFLGQQRLEGTYELIEVPSDETSTLLDQMQKNKMHGLNVTIPYKETLLPYMAEISPEVEKIGALNTILLKDGKAYGYNTDYYGVLNMFEKAGVKISGKSVVVLGGGGAAKAVIYAMLSANAKNVTVAVRDTKKGEELVRRFNSLDLCTFEEMPKADIVVNTTPVGMFPNTGKSVIPYEMLARFQTAADIVYNPLMTQFLQDAKEQGLSIVTGLAMLTGQAARSEEIWLGTKIPQEDVDKVTDMLADNFLT